MAALSIFRPGLLASRLLLLLLLAGSAGCVEPYAPEVIDAPTSFLVIDGFINADGPTSIRLSRTASLDAKATPPPEAKARLQVEDEALGVVFGLTETAPGVYVAPATRLNPAHRYRLRIATSKGQEYASAYLPVKLTPPIDAVRWKPQGNSVNILVSTHDDTRASEYYRWEYVETWEIRSPYQPNIEYYNRAVSSIRVPYPGVCWSTEQSNRIVLTKTTSLGQDVVSDFRIQGVGAQNPQLYSRYSILVRQQSLTKEEYTYWEQLRKNTESIGSLFDPQPSQVTGNVRGLTDPNAMVLGFVGTHSVTEQRLFIDYKELPTEWRRQSGYEACLPPDTVFIVPRPPAFSPVEPQLAIDIAFGGQALLPISSIPGNGPGSIIGYTAKARDCIDCRTRGTAVKPSFW
ncbi:DUF4249 domain-containing protein [Hymenobacter psychrophilus]|uniref:DUF4249 domain-containing protein n=1 Tax=Hymenobacter psychrophilus TaxID=651662 RepID=A0A1H3JMT4_9BACT|nr:DUF4249 domain-containing protein [Hymenobacter psychrophilus]SDY40564.1 protein of unknown function [Hymenobacter psychrophilus]